MTKRIQIFIAALFAVINLNAKDSCRLRLVEAYVAGGGYSANSERITPAQYRSYLSESQILYYYYPTGFTNYGIYKNTESVTVNLMLGFKSNQKNGPTYRLGFNIGEGSYISGSSYITESYRFDTLVSPRTGATTYVDSVYHEGYNFNTRSDLIQLDISAIWRTKNPNNLTLYGGIGAFIGTSFNVFSEIRHYRYDYIKETRSTTTTTNNNDYYYDSYGRKMTYDNTETFKSANHMSYGIYIPIGVDLRLSKKKEFWRHFHLIFESRAQLQAYKFTGISKDNNALYNGLFGMRYQFE